MNVVDEIMVLSDRHPRYVYILCFELWLRCKEKLPTLKDVQLAWQEYVLSQQKDVRDNLAKRSQVQKKLLETIALGNNQQLTSKQNQLKLQLTSSSIVQALSVLEELDYIEKLADGSYRIIDPLIVYSLQIAHRGMPEC